MQLIENSSAQKLRGAYYTPASLADAIVSLLSDRSYKTILEPSCGDGVFIESLNSIGLLEKDVSITGVEIEKDEARKVKSRYIDNSQVNVIAEDFLHYYESEGKQKSFDLILGNPPYIRYQYLSKEQRHIQAQILKENGMKANKLINAWVCFLVACVQMLSDEGVIAFIVPAEILQVAYAEELRLFLSNHLSRMTLITFEKLVFPNIEQEIVVFIGEKGEEEKGIRIVEMKTLNDFEGLDLYENGFQKLWHTKEKWTKYFITEEEVELIDSIKSDNKFVRFSELALINVGITTGNNDYFSINKETENDYNLSSVTMPLIGRSSHAHGIFFTEEDWRKNIKGGKKAALINFPDISIEEYDEAHRLYIENGEKTGQNIGYKCQIRDRWYIVPSVWVPDAFFLRRNNLYPKFVLNKCGAVSTDTMHRIKFNTNVDPETVLLSYYNSVSFAFVEICGRSYGGGVLEILPGEVGNILLPTVPFIDNSRKGALIEKIDEVVRNDKDIEIALDFVDETILIDMLGIDRKVCHTCRRIWKKMQKRRLGRA